MQTQTKIVSNQTSAVYRLLCGQPPLSAKEIADKLDILPNGVYRLVRRLNELGMVKQLSSYPVRYKALPSSTAMNWYLLTAAHSFKQEFPVPKPDEALISVGPRITLIKDRQNLLLHGDVDVRAATQSVDFVVSGLEVPDSTVLAFRKAAAVGVAIRAIVQQKRETSAERLEKWQDLGAVVKYLPDVGMRLVVIDQRITYLTSYDATNRSSAFGVRLDYEPLAIQMSGLFEQNWQKAQDIWA